MSASVTCHHVTVSRGGRVVLDAVDLAVLPGRRTGLVGPNGTGKSTLLGAIAGVVPVDAGEIRRSPATATIGLLGQEPERPVDVTVRELVRRRTGVAAAQREFDDAVAAFGAGGEGVDDRYAAALDRWTRLGAADLDARVGGVWADLGLDPRLLDQPPATLSGGEAARVSLATLQLSSFDVYLLDEPTNDLDLDGLERLESWVLDQRVGMLLVSHDRRFLERTVTHVAELDEFTHRVTEYAGGWTSFLDERETARRRARERYDEYDRKRGELAARAQREREWASQGQAKVRRDDEPDKNIRAFKLDQTEQLAGKAARTQKMIDRLDVVDEPREAWELRFSIGETGRAGDRVIELSGVVVERPGFRLGPVDLMIGHGERIALVGPNGSGKTTLISVMLGREDPSAGRVRLGPSVVVGEIEQLRAQLTGADTLVRAFQDSTGMSVSEARTLLAKFGLGAEHVARTTASLSPGERTRASMALLMARGVNLLVLDEPTNHLDLAAIEQLTAAIERFAGTVVLVTHDRALLDDVRLDRWLRLDGGRLVSDAPVDATDNAPVDTPDDAPDDAPPDR